MANILIVGSGAMALLFGARLVRAGFDVTLLGTWQEGIQAINQSGIRIDDKQNPLVYPASGKTDLSEIPPVKMALVLVKSWQTERAARQLSQVLHQDGIALSLQNGLGNIEILSQILGNERVAQGVTTYGATLLGPGVVRPGGEGLISVQSLPRLDLIIQYLQHAGFKVQRIADLSSLVWGKVIINVAINPLTALLNVKNGQLLESRSSLEIMQETAEEAANVARALGIQLGFKDPAAEVQRIAFATADNISSMLQDIRRGALTEIDALCGAVVRAGRSVDLRTPVNELLMLLIRAREDINREIDYENH